jgi:hypothetical protein
VVLTQRVSVWKRDSETPAIPQKLAAGLLKPLTALQFSSTAHIARQNRQLCSELAQLDALVDGGIVRARISELIDLINAGPTSLAAALAASVTYRDQVVARTTRHIGQCWYPEHSTDHQRHNLFYITSAGRPQRGSLNARARAAPLRGRTKQRPQGAIHENRQSHRL